MSAPAVVALECSGPVVPDSDHAACRDAWCIVRGRFGLRPDNGQSLITLPESQPKVGLNVRPTASLTFTSGSDAYGLCVNDRACRDTCVVGMGGRGTLDNVVRSRAARTEFLTRYPAQALGLIMARLTVAHDRHGIMDLRPNANSDIAWERFAPALLELLASWGGRAYDYTKRRDRVGMLAPNYRTTYSLTRATARPDTVRRILGTGATVTAVFPSGYGVPAVWRGFPVVDGDTTDDRYADPSGVVVGLKAKGKLRGFDVHPLLVPVS